MRLVVVSPVRHEEPHLQRVIDAVRAQRRPPDRWLIVDDGSLDATFAIARRAAEQTRWIEALRAPQRVSPAQSDRLAAAAEALAFAHALEHLGDDPWDVLAKLDGDMVLDPAHYERLLAELEADPQLGIVGCFFEEQRPDGSRHLGEMPEYHVNGALKTWRRACWEEIGGIVERLGWDTIDETRARMLGWRTRSLRDVRALHLRPSGSVGGVLRGRARHGECVWLVNYPPELILARSVRLMGARPPVLSGLAFLYGWARAAVRRRGRIEDRELLRFARREQRQRLRRWLTGTLRRSPGSPSRR